ncbi:hypothetical protein K469DRAFT_705095 [Zopfia rhizophila CBS 207.26]|uniref:Siderophore biosynthesis enzyme n=1 Tax=Zopfia rhizophila CBS 207.26 TaxID=1314779 RepID=A0A6A6EC54_9PEZI|nr:hypothetical protein K469DRAFT_705095 [Zopfia rhizophila CBS 207.26]
MRYTALALALAATSFAKTNLAGCTSSDIGASRLYYVPDTGEICSILDCGGGRAPPKTTVPGCAAYKGTATYEPSFLSGYGPNKAPASTSAPATSAVQTDASSTHTSSALSSFATITAAPQSSGVIGTGNQSPTVAPSGGNNLTATATLPSQSANPSAPAGTGAANILAVAGKGVFGLALGVAGLAML